MFLVINREKLSAYIVSIVTVVMMFAVANVVTPKQNTVETVAGTENTHSTYSVKATEKKVALTMKCEANDDLDAILNTLNKNNVHITFFLDDDYTDKNKNVAAKIRESGSEIGSYSNNTAKENEYYTIKWCIDTLDCKKPTGEEMCKKIDKKIQPGSIILTHSGIENAADSLEMIIKNIKSKGYEIVTVSNLVKSDYTIDENGVQVKK